MLKISAKCEYGLILAKYLTRQDSYKKIQEISFETWLKEPILRKIVNSLEKSGIIKSIKWRNWWIQLIKNNLSVFDVVSSIKWNELKVAVCSSKICSNQNNCEISPIVANLQKWLESVLKITKI